VISFLIYAVLLLICAAVTGTSHTVKVPGWTFIALAIVVGLVLVALAVPAGRKLLLSRLAAAAGQVVARLLDVAQQPTKLAQGVGGALLVTIAYILCLAASVKAIGGPVPPLASVAVVFLTGSAVGSLFPTPGGIGAVEAAISAGLIAAGVPGSKAFAAVLLYRTVTFWLPVPVGWFAMQYLQRRDVLLSALCRARAANADQHGRQACDGHDRPDDRPHGVTRHEAAADDSEALQCPDDSGDGQHRARCHERPASHDAAPSDRRDPPPKPAVPPPGRRPAGPGPMRKNAGPAPKVRATAWCRSRPRIRRP
jgi:lysylphosphatidylglycerol synthase-like protein